MEILSVISKLSQFYRKTAVWGLFLALRIPILYQKLFHMKHSREFFAVFDVSRETIGAKRSIWCKIGCFYGFFNEFAEKFDIFAMKNFDFIVTPYITEFLNKKTSLYI